MHEDYLITSEEYNTAINEDFFQETFVKAITTIQQAMKTIILFA